jgi:Icc-related predicted phosphoesterase
LKFVAISDTHCRHRSIKLPKADVIIHAGDLSNKGEKAEVADFLDWFGDLDYTHKIFIAGNHDFYFEIDKKIEHIIPVNVTYLNDSGVTINGINIWGSPVTPWFFNWAFNRERGKPIQKHWQMIPEDTDLLIVHGPPYGILDQVINERHVGCRDLLERLKVVKPKVVVTGHVHESYGVMKQSGIKFINASILNESYELVNKPIVFEL